ncbi:hypothetical protein AKJ16_DCAP06939 [Drosera capensis]
MMKLEIEKWNILCKAFPVQNFQVSGKKKLLLQSNTKLGLFQLYVARYMNESRANGLIPNGFSTSEDSNELINLQLSQPESQSQQASAIITQLGSAHIGHLIIAMYRRLL